ncbi:hypothetical protein TASIC1_0002058500 [Trichoderma asperellum]|uniref:Uncharacterized protein n=1 Tax=Trichoderma asperellum TaxID=101201 RepID=A0A6V8QLP0_TRIAP|nr:hypothetical protein TASIC1_0002058500 [Trichoderma asperellum]
MGGLLWRGQSLVPASTGILAAFSPTPHLQLVAIFSSAIFSSRSILLLRRRLDIRRLAAPAVVPCARLDPTRLDSWPPCLGATTAALLCVAPAPAVRNLARLRQKPPLLREHLRQTLAALRLPQD